MVVEVLLIPRDTKYFGSFHTACTVHTRYLRILVRALLRSSSSGRQYKMERVSTAAGGGCSTLASKESLERCFRFSRGTPPKTRFLTNTRRTVREIYHITWTILLGAVGGVCLYRCKLFFSCLFFCFSVKQVSSIGISSDPTRTCVSPKEGI